MSPSRSPLPAKILTFWLLAMVALTAWSGFQAYSLVGKPFNGFLAQPLLYVSPYQLGRWNVEATGIAVVDQLLAADGRPLVDTADLLARARAVPAGTVLSYEVRRAGQVRTERVPTRLFTWQDFFGTFGTLALLGWEFTAIGLAVFALRPDLPAARCLAYATGWLGLLLVVYLDYHTSGTLSRLFLVSYSLMAAGFLALALEFPRPLAVLRRAPWLRAVPWVLGMAMMVAFQLAHLSRGPAVVERALYERCFAIAFIANTWMMLALIGLIGAIAWGLATAPRHSQPRLQSGIALAGVGLGLFPSVLWGMQLNTGHTPWVPLSLAFMFLGIFPLSMAYAIVKARLFDSTVVLRRSVLYLVFSTGIAAAYVLVAAGMRLLGWSGAGHPAAELLTTALIAGLALSLRDALQGFIDRLLFREAYDAQLALEEASRSMTALLDRDAIVERVGATVAATLRPASGAMLVREDDGTYQLVGTWGAALPEALPADHPLVEALSAGQTVVLPGLETPGRTRPSAHLEALGAAVAIPLMVQGALSGALILGPKRADTAYTAQDLQLLQILANQSAIALENARGVRRLQAFNVELEAKVASRTAEVEHALSELKAAQAMLVHAEKMAALGLLVGGVAHELNNPLTFVTGGADLLDERLGELRALLPAAPGQASATEMLALIEEMEVMLGACREGAERARAIVQSLRDFSRLDEFERQPVDLAAGLVSTVALVKPAFKDRVAIELELAAVPPVAGSAGHLNQVFTNILMNACQAIKEAGTVRVGLAAADDGVVVTIADTGVGMSEAVRSRIFDPFYTTKPPGQGTGLGLAICLGIMEEHGGRIEVESAPGRGTTFRLSFPASAAREALPAGRSAR